MKAHLLRLILTAAIAAPAFAESPKVAAPPAASPELAKLSTEMADAANKLLASLTPEQKAAASFEFGPVNIDAAIDKKDNERLNWHFIPKPRKGLTMKIMTPEQRELAKALLRTGLSEGGAQKLYAIMSLEEVLRVAEASTAGGGRNRDSENYFWSLFGKPGDTAAPWGWRVEGHHFSSNFTVVSGKAAAGGPIFYGTNPAEVREGPKKGLRVLAEEEDLGRALVKSLTPEQMKKALINTTAPKDIITVADRRVKLEKFEGLPLGELTDAQKAALAQLIDVHANHFRAELANDDIARMRAAGLDKIYFAWAGEIEPNKPHYYRVHGPTFLIEYDNTQNNANHVHIVWRDLQNDFGGDMLKKHYNESHK